MMRIVKGGIQKRRYILRRKKKRIYIGSQMEIKRSRDYLRKARNSRTKTRTRARTKARTRNSRDCRTT
jgi:hypothetical protein